MEELFAGRRVVAFWAGGAFAGRKAWVGDAATETATEGAGVAALAFRVGVRVDGVFVVGLGRVGWWCDGG